MRVIYSIGAKFAGGGIGTVAYYAVSGLHRQGALRRLLCSSYRPTGIPTSLIRQMGLVSRGLRRAALYDPGHRLHYIHNWLYDAWAARYLESVDLFHVWANYGLRSLRRAKACGAITVVEHASTHPLARRALLQEEYARWGLTFRQPQVSIRRALQEMEQADYVLIPSDFVRWSFLAHGVPEEKLIQIPFGVDIQRFRPAEQRKEGPFRVLSVGQVNVRKGVLYLLEAWESLNWPDAELWIVGRVDNALRPMLTSYRGLAGVRFVGHVNDPASVYQQADAFAFPTIEEGSALVTYEALACGLPVVTTPNAGSVVRDGIEGFIIPIRDVEALASALERLRADERLRREIGKAARARAEAFTWERYGDALMEAYRHRAAGSRI